VNRENHLGEAEPAVHRREWKRIHHSPLFWFGFCLFLPAITIYVLSDDLSWRPHIGYHRVQNQRGSVAQSGKTE
jgi:hypothetical protein